MLRPAVPHELTQALPDRERHVGTATRPSKGCDRWELDCLSQHLQHWRCKDELVHLCRSVAQAGWVGVNGTRPLQFCSGRDRQWDVQWEPCRTARKGRQGRRGPTSFWQPGRAKCSGGSARWQTCAAQPDRRVGPQAEGGPVLMFVCRFFTKLCLCGDRSGPDCWLTVSQPHCRLPTQNTRQCAPSCHSTSAVGDAAPSGKRSGAASV